MGTRVLFRMVKLSEERKLRLTALFRAFDYDSSGAIEPQEFLCIGKALKNGEWTEEMNAKAHARVDTDKGGSIDVLEFCSFFENNMPKNRTDEQSFKLKAEADARAVAHEQSTKFIAKQERHLKRRGMYARTAGYAAEYASQESSLVRQRRQAKAAGNYFCEPEAKLMFVIRIRGMCDMHPKTKKILQLLRLRQIHLGVFLRVNKATQEMIKRLSHTLPTDTHPSRPPVSSSTSVDSARRRPWDKPSASPSTATMTSRSPSATTASTALRISSTRSTPSAQPSSKPTTSSGHSS